MAKHCIKNIIGLLAIFSDLDICYKYFLYQLAAFDKQLRIDHFSTWMTKFMRWTETDSFQFYNNLCSFQTNSEITNTQKCRNFLSNHFNVFIIWQVEIKKKFIIDELKTYRSFNLNLLFSYMLIQYVLYFCSQANFCIWYGCNS